MKSSKVGVVQIPSENGGIHRNLDAHLNAIEVAAKWKVSFLAFPELSLVGYTPELSQALAVSLEDYRLKPLPLCRHK